MFFQFGFAPSLNIFELCNSCAQFKPADGITPDERETIADACQKRPEPTKRMQGLLND